MKKSSTLAFAIVINIAVSHAQWQLNGNPISSTNFFGSTNAQPLVLKVNNFRSGLIDHDATKGNTLFGYQALVSNAGIFNTSVGYKSLNSNTSGGYNNAFGYNTLLRNTTGRANSAFGYQALYFNTTGYNNVAIGTLALWTNNTGTYNTACGDASLTNNTSGSHNTAFGTHALSTNMTGSNNTSLGWAADVSTASLTNATAIGSGAIVNASNKVVIGNTSVTSIGGYAPWSNFSDGRYKRNIKEDVPGLEFIKKLKPVTYTIDVRSLEFKLHEHQKKVKSPNSTLSNLQDDYATDATEPATAEKSKIIYTGFVAQDVEKAAQSINYNFSGVDKPKDDNESFYALRYSDFVAPLVKAVQELSAQNDKLALENQQMQSQLDELIKRLNALELASSPSVISNSLSPNVNDKAGLEQNSPNPFNNNTVIRYHIPSNGNNAQIMVTDVSGHTLKNIYLSKGSGQVTITAGTLPSGNYIYSLIVDGKKIDSKQMVLTK
ncbi:MAG TPA: tail fiber domain-containing protein [Chitinophagaceae bacterium]|jgi:hypothetical protein